MAAGLLRKGGYRSAKAYLSVIKASSILKGGRRTRQFDRTLRELNRAFEKGLGPALKVDPLPWEVLYHMPLGQVDAERQD